MSEYLKKLTITTADGERKEMLVPYGPEIDARFSDVCHTLGDLNTTITEHATRFPKMDGLSRNMFEIVMRMHGFNISSSWSTMDLEGGSGYIDDEGRILIAQNNKIIYSNFDCAISDVTLSELYNKDASKIAELAPGIFEIKTSDWSSIFGLPTTFNTPITHRISFSGHPTNLSWMTSINYGSYKNGVYALIDIRNVNTSRVVNMSNMFRSSIGITSLDLTDIVTSQVTDMSWMFYGCSALTSLDVSNFDTSNVTSMSNMFYGCSAITSLNVSNFDTTNVTDMSYLFCLCSALTSLDVSNFDTSNVTSMSYMFSYLYSLTSLDLSSFDTSNVTDMNRMFMLSSALTSLDLSSFDTSNVTDMGCMFNGCSSLTSLDLSNFDTSKVTTMDSLFKNCSGITSLDVSNLDTSNVTEMLYMFGGCTGLTSLDVSMFDTSKVTDMYHMFEYDAGITSLDLSNFDTSNVKDMRGVFYECSGLTQLDISSFNLSNATNIDSLFQGCSGLKSLDVSHFDTSKVNVVRYVFRNCTSLKSLKLRFNLSGASYTEKLFDGCTALEHLEWDNLGEGNTRIAVTVDFSPCPLSRESIEYCFLTHIFNRTSIAGRKTFNIKLSAASKALLTDEEIASITAKGFTII